MNLLDLKAGDLVLAKNNQFIAFNKPAGLPAQSDKEGNDSLQKLAERYVRHPLHLIHRIDQGATGVVLMAQHDNSAASLHELMREGKMQRTYLAVVRNAPEAEQGILKHNLLHIQKINKSVVVEVAEAGALAAELLYRTVAKSDTYTLLEVKLVSGRHHQIRAQLGAIGSPIKGDIKYGFRRGNIDRSIHLHAWKLSFEHPVSGDFIEIEAPLPDEKLWQFFGEELSK